MPPTSVCTEFIEVRGLEDANLHTNIPSHPPFGSRLGFVFFIFLFFKIGLQEYLWKAK